jgi:hypothetical protein
MARQDWRTFLDTQQPLLAAAARCESFGDPATVARLRRHGDAESVRRAIDLTIARRKAAAKFDRADELIADAEAVEQASNQHVAMHKARRFAAAGVTDVVDLCCGIGGDAMALARVAEVTLIDHDPDRAWAGRHNVALVTGRTCPTAVADVTALNLTDRAIHLDPARRQAGRRTHRYEDYQPSPTFISAMLKSNPTSAIKLGPGVNLDQLPAGEVEFISDAGSLVQAVLWTGKLQSHERSATVLPAHETLIGSPDVIPPITPPNDYLLAVDPAVERAGLIAALCEQLNVDCVHPQLGLLTTDQPVISPFTRTYRRLTSMPYRPRKVDQWLTAHDGGIVTIKTRDKVVNPDALQVELRGQGETPYSLFILRHDQQVQCHITQPLM